MAILIPTLQSSLKQESQGRNLISDAVPLDYLTRFHLEHREYCSLLEFFNFVFGCMWSVIRLTESEKLLWLYPKNYEFETRKRKGLWSSLIILSQEIVDSSSNETGNSNFLSCSRMDSDAHQWIVFFSPDSNPWYLAIIELAMHPGNCDEQCWRKNPYDKGPRFRLSNSANESTLVQALSLKPSLPYNGLSSEGQKKMWDPSHVKCNFPFSNFPSERHLFDTNFT